MLLFESFLSFLFLSVFLMIFFCLMLCQTIFRWLASFWDFFFFFFVFFVFKESTLPYLKKIQVKRKLLRKFLESPNQRACYETLLSFVREFILIIVSRIACWVFEFWLWINGKTIKTPCFYNDTYLHFCLIYLRLDVHVSWLTDI